MFSKVLLTFSNFRGTLGSLRDFLNIHRHFIYAPLKLYMKIYFSHFQRLFFLEFVFLIFRGCFSHFQSQFFSILEFDYFREVFFSFGHLCFYVLKFAIFSLRISQTQTLSANAGEVWRNAKLTSYFWVMLQVRNLCKTFFFMIILFIAKNYGEPLANIGRTMANLLYSQKYFKVRKRGQTKFFLKIINFMSY